MRWGDGVDRRLGDVLLFCIFCTACANWALCRAQAEHVGAFPIQCPRGKIARQTPPAYCASWNKALCIWLTFALFLCNLECVAVLTYRRGELLWPPARPCFLKL